MRTIEYRTMNNEKALWGKGEWTHEPDKIQFLDHDSKLPCLIVRNRLGALCGYVGVDKSHPLYEKHYDDNSCFDIEIHGGLTYSDHCISSDESGTVCHKVDPGEDDDIWWFGFDCAHSGDYLPGINFNSTPNSNYKNVAYVRDQLKSLIKQFLGRSI